MKAAEFADILDAVRRFVRGEVVPREQEIEDTDAIPADIRRAAIQMGRSSTGSRSWPRGRSSLSRSPRPRPGQTRPD